MTDPVSTRAAPSSGSDEPLAPATSWIQRAVGALGVWFIYGLIRVFGRVHRSAHVSWLEGPVGGALIGDATYREVAEREGLALERGALDGGLIPDFNALTGPGFNPSRVHPAVRDFYEHTARYAMDVWSQSHFPGNVGLWLLVTTISREVNQLNFPLSPLDSAPGISSEILNLRQPDGAIRYTGWFRTLAQRGRVLYTGFYMTVKAPSEATPSVKVVFPMPDGNATVVLRPLNDGGSGLVLDSSGRCFGGAGFYRISVAGVGRLRIWHVRTLKEHFHVYVDAAGTLRCDHSVRFLGLPVLRLHYKIFPREPEGTPFDLYRS